MITLRLFTFLCGFLSCWVSLGQPSCSVAGTAAIDQAYDPMAGIPGFFFPLHPNQTYQVEEIELLSTGESIISLNTLDIENGTIVGGDSRMVKLSADGTVRCFVFGCTGRLSARKFYIDSLQNVVLGRDASEGGFTPLIMDGSGNALNNFPLISSRLGDIIHALAYQPDGKLVVSYGVCTQEGCPPTLLRLNANGSFDSSFPARNLEAKVIRLQPDGKLLIAGNFPGGLIRVLPDGSDDPEFQNPAVAGIVNDLVRLPDGKILIVGAFSSVGVFPRNGIALLKRDGSVDADFNPGAGIGTEANTFIKWVKRMANGKFLIGGTFTTYNNIERNGLAMVEEGGTLDCSFKAQQPLSGLVDDAVVQADGKIILAGSFTEYNGVTRKGLVRIDPAPAQPAIPAGGLRLWLRADDLNLANDAPVSGWNDASGAGNHFDVNNVTENSRPIFKAGCPGVLNGKPYITWKGSGPVSWFSRSDALGMPPNTARTYIAVYRLFNTSARSFVLQHGDFSTPGTYHGFDANTFNTQGNRFGVYATNNAYDSDRPTDGLFHIQFMAANSMAVNTDILTDTEYRINDTLRMLTRTAGGLGNGKYESFASANEFRIGGWVELAEVIVYNRTLSAIERTDIHTYLRNKYGNFPLAPPPEPAGIYSFFPPSGAPGSTVTITGYDFTGATTVSFNHVPANITVVSGTTITATVPSGATTGRINVKSGCTTTSSGEDFTVTGSPFPGTSFVQTASLATGPTPREVLMSDLNGDGFLDVITSVVGTGQLQVFNGTGAGCFNSTQNFPTLAAGHGLALADFNADGRPDVAVSSGNQSQLAVLLNSSTGLQPPTLYATGAAGALPRHINTGDLNGDGRIDIVAASSASLGRFSILYNQGAGTFAAGVDFNTAQGPVYFVAMADFNRDNRLDVVTANFSGSLSIFINNGAGGFLAERVIGLRSGTHFVVARDFNGDGAPDIAAANALDNSASVLINQGDGNFLPPVHYATGSYPTSMAVGDLHKDGKDDLVVAHAFGASFGVLPGNGLGEFGPRLDFPASGQPYSVALGDLTGDGFPDVVATNLSGNQLNFHLSSPFSAPAAPVATPATVCAGTSATLIVSGGVNGQYRWYTDASGPTQIAGEVNANFVTPALATTTTFFVAIRNGACESTRTAVVATVIAAPAPPTASSVTICSGSRATLTASGGSTGQYQWYTQPAGGTPLAGETNATFTSPMLTANAAYYVSINNGACESNRSEAAVTVKPLPAEPTATGAGRCGSGSLTLSASGGGAGQYRWYVSSSGGSPIPNETNSAYAISSLATTTTYYVSINNGECESGRVGVVATINPVPDAPSVTDASRCGPGSVTLSASGGAPGQYRWYMEATGGTPIPSQTNSTFTTSTAGTYYVSMNNGECESTRKAVEAKINSIPATPVGTSSLPLVNNQVELCPTTAVTLTAPAGFAGYTWSTGSSGLTTTVSQAGTVSLTVRNSEGCTSAPWSLTVISRSCTPAITPPSPPTIPVEGSLSINVTTLISSILPIVPGSLRVTVPPRSGATAAFSAAGELKINYSGVLFAGKDQLTIEVCNVAGECGSQVISIDVVGDIVVYNGISPNGDGQNDYFYIQYIDILPAASENRVMIFNRWGDRVWQTTNYNNTSNRFEGLSTSGAELPSGTYFYRIQFASDVPERNGYLTIRR